MPYADVTSLLTTALPPGSFEVIQAGDDMPTVIVPVDRVIDLATVLRDHPALQFALLVDLTAVDLLPRTPRFEVIYHFVSIEHTLRLRVKVRLADEDPRIPTVSRIWPAANWLEREVLDLFGITFDNHPDPRRLMMPEDWQGHPLRKDYPVQVNVPVKVHEPLVLTEDEFRASLEADRTGRGPKA